MDLEEKWNKAVKETQIIRSRFGRLSVTEATPIAYIFLGPSVINIGDTVVRQGKIIIDKPMIFLPKNLPQFLGFDLQEELGVNDNTLRAFLVIRGIQFPSLKYQHEVSTIDVFEGDLEKAIAHYGNLLERKEDVETVLLAGAAEIWQFSILLYVSLILQRSNSKDLDNLLERFMDGLE